MTKSIYFSNEQTLSENWLAIEQSLETFYEDNKLNYEDHNEIERCKRITNIIYERLNNTNIDFISETRWQNIQNKTEEIYDYLSTIIREPYLFEKHDLESKFDYFWDNFCLLISLPPISIKETQDELTKVLEIKNKLKTNLAKSEEYVESTYTNSNKIEHLAIASLSEYSGESSFEEKIKKFTEELNQEKIEIDEYYNELLKGAGSQSIKGQVSDAATFVKDKKDYISSLINETEEEIKELKTFYDKVFTYQHESGKNSLKKELEIGFQKVEDLSAKQKAEHNQRLTILETYEKKQKDIHDALKEQIEKLLPSATTAGLATGYHEARKTFNIPIWIHTGVFYISTITIAGLAFFLHQDATTHQELISKLASKLPLFLPLIWLSYFASKRRSESQRLQQEYAHKEYLAKSYLGFKHQIEELGEEDQALVKKLLAEAVTAVGFNPSSTLGDKHGDKHPLQECLENGVKMLNGNGNNTKSTE